MDLVTQAALGAAVGEATLGKKLGNKAVYWGALGGIIPDLDVLGFPFMNAVERFVTHRTLTHSFFFAFLFSPLLAYLVRGFYSWRQKKGGPLYDVAWREWTALFFLCIVTHFLLDCLTVYGTRIFYPFSDYAVGLNTIFIIDPSYTLPLLLGTALAMRLKRGDPRRVKRNFVGLLIAHIYLTLGMIAGYQAGLVIQDSLRDQNIEYREFITTPTPFNIILWRGLAKTSEGFYEGHYSLLDASKSVKFHYIPGNPTLLDKRPARARLDLERLGRAANGFYALSPGEGAQKVVVLRYVDLRFENTGKLMGPDAPDNNVFEFHVLSGGSVIQKARTIPPWSDIKHMFALLWNRILGRTDPRLY